MSKKLVYIPCSFPSTGWHSALVETADGSQIAITCGCFELVEQKFCLVAEYLTEEGEQHRVRFADGTVALVYPSPAWAYDPNRHDYYASTF